MVGCLKCHQHETELIGDESSSRGPLHLQFQSRSLARGFHLQWCGAHCSPDSSTFLRANDEDNTQWATKETLLPL